MATIEISYIRAVLPDLSNLLAAATSEGENSVSRLLDDWQSGALGFDAKGEALLLARVAGLAVGIGGISREPSMEGALRMRRFYVLPSERNCGIGTAIAHELMETPERRGTLLTVHAGNSAAAAFWETLGFEGVNNRPYSHQRQVQDQHRLAV